MSKQLKPVIQRPKDLILAVVHQDVLPITQTLIERVVAADAWQIRFAIIGESHRVQITHQGQFVLEEMLACVEIPLQACQHHHPFTDLQAHDFLASAYRVSVYMSRNMYWQESAQEIAYTFPEIDGIQAMTRIQWQESERAIQWRTLHTYIDSGTVLCVYSESEFDLQTEDTA